MKNTLTYSSSSLPPQRKGGIAGAPNFASEAKVRINVKNESEARKWLGKM